MPHPSALPFGALTAIGRPGRPRVVAAGEVLARAGDPTRSHVVVVTGVLETRRDGHTLARATAGEVADTRPADGPRSTDLVALTDAVILELPLRDLRGGRPGLTPAADAA